MSQCGKFGAWCKDLDRKSWLTLLILAGLLLLSCLDFNGVHFPGPVALAVIATLGYLIGRGANTAIDSEAIRARREWKRAQAVALELETIAEAVREHLNRHRASVARFKNRISQLGNSGEGGAWQDLCTEAEEVLRPTLQLGSQIAQAYDQIRQQTNHLMAFSDVRTDPLTRVMNRRGLDGTLESLFALLNRYEQPFSIAMFDLDNFKKVNDEKGHLFGDHMLQSVANVIDMNVRDTDLVARYGGEEFVVVMPQTALDGACVFAERLRQSVEKGVGMTVSGGVATALEGDDPPSLLARADAGMYAAKSAGRNRVFRHTGSGIELVVEVQATPAPQSVTVEA